MKIEPVMISDETVEVALDAYEQAPGVMQGVAMRSAIAAAMNVMLGEPVAWMTKHDEPMLFPSLDEAASFCDEDEQPAPLYTLNNGEKQG